MLEINGEKGKQQQQQQQQQQPTHWTIITSMQNKPSASLTTNPTE